MRHRILKPVMGLCAFTGIAMTACASDHHDNDTPLPPAEPEEPVMTGKFGLERQEVLDYFAAALNNEPAQFDNRLIIKHEDIGGGKNYVWELWSTAVRRASGEKLPTLSSHYKLSSWADIKTPDGIWKVPEGDMDIFYGTKGSRPADGYPLFLFLHGSGADPQAEWTACLGHAEAFADGPSAYFLPKSPQGGTGTRWFQPSKQEKWERLLRQALVSDKINPEKIYFIGISEGAYGSQRLASFYADYLAGAGPIAGGEFLSNCPPENLANTAFCLQTGALDKSYARDLLTAKVSTLLDGLQAAHPGYYTHKVDLQPGYGHGCDYYQTTPWLLNHTRKATPKYVYWENFGMGDINDEPRRYRDTFYNLRIIEPSDDRSDPMVRTAYEMTITGNVINLTVNNVTLTTDEPATPPTGNVNIGVQKTTTPATTGKIRIYLGDELIDLSQPVTVNVNGTEKFNGTVEPNTYDLVESCRIFFDPLRLFPASVDVTVQ